MYIFYLNDVFRFYFGMVDLKTFHTLKTLPSPGGEHMYKHLLLILLFRLDLVTGSASISGYKMSEVPE